MSLHNFLVFAWNLYTNGARGLCVWDYSRLLGSNAYSKISPNKKQNKTYGLPLSHNKMGKWNNCPLVCKASSEKLPVLVSFLAKAICIATSVHSTGKEESCRISTVSLISICALPSCRIPWVTSIQYLQRFSRVLAFVTVQGESMAYRGKTWGTYNWPWRAWISSKDIKLKIVYGYLSNAEDDSQ